MSVIVRWGATTDVGQVRAVNQDAFDGLDWLCVVADGMGGHRGGEVASATAVKAIVDADLTRSTDRIVEAVNHANSVVKDAADADMSLAGMGTTLTMVAVVETEEGDRIAIANVGDSRTYLYSSDVLTQITEDHSLVASLVRQGRLTEDQATTHPQRNVVTRALGIDARVLVDAWEVSPVTGDRYVLCSDGLTNELTDNQIAAVLRRLADPQEASEELVRLANEHGGNDNITVAVVDVVEADADLDGTSIADRVGAPRRAIADVAATPALDDAPEPTSSKETALTDDDHITALKERASEARRPEVQTARTPMLTWRVVAFFAALLAIVGVVVVVVAAEAAGSYFVGVDDGEVVVFKGKADGSVLNPEIVGTPGIDFDLLTDEEKAQVKLEPTFGSVAEAEEYIRGLEQVVGNDPPLNEPSDTPSSEDDVNF